MREEENMHRAFVAAVVLAVAAIPAYAFAGPAKGGSLHATLTGKAETPKGDANGAGTAEVKFVSGKVCWEIKVSRIAKPAAAHIHKGRPGVAGPVVVPFGGAYKAKGCIATPAKKIAAIRANPGAYYVNVHNAAFPAGAVRGQLRADD